MTSKPKLIERLTDRWQVKAICFAIAVFLYIFYQASLIDKKSFVIPLAVEQNGSMINVGKIPEYVTVVVRTTPEEMNYVTSSEIKASVDLSYLTEPGTHKVPVTVSLSEKLMGLDILEISLRQEVLDVTVERRDVKYVPLEPSVTGEVAHGMKISEISISPSTVEISGAESVVAATESVRTTQVLVSNAERNFTTEAYYLEVNKLIEVADKGPYKVTVSLENERMQKEFSLVEAAVVNLDDAFRIDSPVPLVSFVLESTVRLLEDYEPSKYSVQLDCSEVTDEGTYELPIKILRPNNVTLVRKSADTVSVTISRVKAEDEPDEEAR